ncbi:hypothetical protein [Streptomyces phytophilus]|uniref:hypothetical protein n=1 Tax=Streptomyces phytophilus TaxID=722715 RepID=UPI0015EFE431|nr:hypothetical protein [Streptomyces phytophilus]
MTYTIKTLRAMQRGIYPNERVHVRVREGGAEGRRVAGRIIGIGSKISVRTDGGELVEDIPAQWVQHAEVVDA